jgi:RNA polymerase sigma-70 factor, ECF subfamily
LMVLISEGNKLAFDVIYDRYWEKLLVYVVKVIKDKEEASDILQDVFVSLWNRRAELSKIECLSAYLFTAVRYKTLVYLKKVATKSKLMTILPESFSDLRNSSEELYYAKELSRLIDREIESLPSKMKQIFVLSRREELSHKEIAQALHISDKTVRKQIQNALKVFRLKLQKEFIIGLLFFVKFFLWFI